MTTSLCRASLFIAALFIFLAPPSFAPTAMCGPELSGGGVGGALTLLTGLILMLQHRRERRPPQ